MSQATTEDDKLSGSEDEALPEEDKSDIELDEEDEVHEESNSSGETEKENMDISMTF